MPDVSRTGSEVDVARGARTFTEWVESLAHDPAAIKAARQARRRKSVLGDLVPRE